MCISFDELNNEQQSTVSAIFADSPSDISWLQVLDLFDVLGRYEEIDGFICVGISIGSSDASEIKRGVFPYSNSQEYLAQHVVGYLQQYLRGVGVEPN